MSQDLFDHLGLLDKNRELHSIYPLFVSVDGAQAHAVSFAQVPGMRLDRVDGIGLFIDGLSVPGAEILAR